MPKPPRFGSGGQLMYAVLTFVPAISMTEDWMSSSITRFTCPWDAARGHCRQPLALAFSSTLRSPDGIRLHAGIHLSCIFSPTHQLDLILHHGCRWCSTGSRTDPSRAHTPFCAQDSSGFRPMLYRTEKNPLWYSSRYIGAFGCEQCLDAPIDVRPWTRMRMCDWTDSPATTCDEPNRRTRTISGSMGSTEGT